MKRCPTCQHTYEDDSQKFCANDGTPLVSDGAPAFDPEATVMSIPRPLLEEQPPAPAQPSQPPQYYNPDAGPSYQPEQNVHQSYAPTPPSTPAAPPAWPPAQPQQQQQPYYPQPGMAGGQAQAPPWQGGQPPQPGWMPPGQQQPQGQNWGGGGGYYPQPGQHATQVSKGRGLSLVTLIVGLISFIALAVIFAIGKRDSGDSDLSKIAFYISGVTGFLAVLMSIITLISSRWRSKWMAILGAVISIPGIAFFIYVVSEYGLP
jgi:hypothetical protein